MFALRWLGWILGFTDVRFELGDQGVRSTCYRTFHFLSLHCHSVRPPHPESINLEGPKRLGLRATM